MAETQPRYEFRVWAQNFGELKERLERRATPIRAVSEETYFVSKTTDRSDRQNPLGVDGYQGVECGTPGP